jgi:phosphate transport system substrate-binding protein
MLALSARIADNSGFVYRPTDSHSGKRCVVAGDCQFGGIDSPLSTEQQRKMPNAWVLPSIAMAVAVGFHLPNVGDLELRIPREALAAIFLGRIRRWSELAEWNPKLENVRENIELVVQSERSVVSEVFTSALSSFSAQWNMTVGSSSLPDWPRSGFLAKDDDGVAIAIKRTPYSLGYISRPTAAKLRVPVALISNQAGTFVAPTTSGVQSAMDAFAAALDEQGRNQTGRNGHRLFFQSIVDPKNQSGAYPISMFTYLLFDAGNLTCSTQYHLLYLVYWSWTDPQAVGLAIRHNVAPISKAVRTALLWTLGDLECNGFGILESVAYDYDNGIVGTGASTP